MGEQQLQQYTWLFPFGFVAFWCLIMALVAQMSGWAKLAEYYRADDFFDGAKRHFQSMAMGTGGVRNANFGGCVTFGVSSYALRLSLLFPFRPFHPPLAIPLADLSAERGKTLLFNAVILRTQRAPEIRITISEALGRWIEESSNGLWKMPAGAAEAPSGGVRRAG
jgi:hypothetical protein